MKTIEYYPDLKNWLLNWDGYEYINISRGVEEKLLEMQKRIDELEYYNLGLAEESNEKSNKVNSLTEENKELQKRIDELESQIDEFVGCVQDADSYLDFNKYTNIMSNSGFHKEFKRLLTVVEPK